MRQWLPPVARLGFAARGALYVVVGARAVRAATGFRHQPTDPQGALRTVERQDFGELLLAALAVGLLAYAVWRFAQAWWDLDRKGTSAFALAVRGSILVSGVLHAGLGLTAVGMLLGFRRGHGNTLRDWVARVLSEPQGEWVVGIAGLATIGVAVAQLRKAWHGHESERLDVSRLPPRTGVWVRRLERSGIAARGVTFALIGWFLVMAAWWRRASEARGLADSLRDLRTRPHGPWLLAAVGLGLAAYGVHSALCARYRRIVA